MDWLATKAAAKISAWHVAGESSALRFIAQPSIWGPVVKQALVWEMRGPSPLLPFARSRLPAGPNLRPRPALPGLLDGQALLLAGAVWPAGRAPGCCRLLHTSLRS
jgi:hypothetical protein